MKHYLSLAIVLFTVVLAGCKNKYPKAKFTFTCEPTSVTTGADVTVKATLADEKTPGKWKVTVKRGDATPFDAATMLTAGKDDETFESTTKKETKFQFAVAGSYKIKCEPVDGAEGEAKEFTITVTAPAAVAPAGGTNAGGTNPGSTTS